MTKIRNDARLTIGFTRAELDELELALEASFRSTAAAAAAASGELLTELETSARTAGAILVRVREQRLRSRYFAERSPLTIATLMAYRGRSSS